MKFFIPILPAVILACTFPLLSKAEEEIHYRSIKAVEGLQFEPVQIKARAGEMLRIAFSNEDPNDQPHNIVIIKPGTLKQIQAASMAVTADSQANGFVPESEHIIAASGLLDADGSEELLFKMPDEKGIYHYICTFPGHAMLMYGAIYVGKSQPALADDPNIPEVARNAEKMRAEALLDVTRPSMLRIFMPEAGPAAIAVALPHEFNYCWDAGNGRLRYLWTGDFLDATGVWRGNGNALGKVLGDEIWKSQPGETLHGIQLGDRPATSYRYEGYDLVDGIPLYHYQIDGTKISETLTSGPDEVHWSFTVDGPKTDVRVLAPTSDKATIFSGIGKRDGDWWVIPRSEASAFTLKLKKS